MNFDFASAVAPSGLAIGVLITVFFAGLRHGFDIDHIAAITDITSSQTDRKKAFGLASIYAAGHAVVVVSLGMLAILAGRSVPAALDSFMGRVIGGTLVLLGFYVVYSAIRFGRDMRIRSRWMLVFAGFRRIVAWVRRNDPVEEIEIVHEHEHGIGDHHTHETLDLRPLGGGGTAVQALTKTHTHTHAHKHVLPAARDPFKEYGRKTAFGVGMLHGIGAETPTQVVLFATAAGVGGQVGGLGVLAAFVIGLFCGNSLLAGFSSLGFGAGRRAPVVYAVMASTTAVLSIGVGSLYLLGRADLLPGFLGG